MADASTLDRLLHDPPGKPIYTWLDTIDGDTGGRMIRLWSYAGAGPLAWGSVDEARAAAWEAYDAR